MRLALFTDTYPPQVNGVAKTLGRLVWHLRARGDSVALVTPRVPGAQPPDVDLHLDPPSLAVPFYPELRLALPLVPAAAKRLRAFAPHVVHVATEFTLGWSGVNWAESNGVPLVSSFHTDFPAYLAGYGFGGLERRAWDYLRAFHDHSVRTFCPSHATLELLRSNRFHDRLSIWSRGVDAELFTPARRSAAVRQQLAPGADQILLYVGRLAPEKRIHVALDAFERLRTRTRRRVALVLVGDGPSADELRKRELQDVHFAGFLHGEALADAYAAGDVFLFPSDTETFGNVVLEAMSSGLPVVAADRGGVTDTVRSGVSGQQVPAGDVAAFAAAAQRLLEDDAERASLAAGARGEALRRSWGNILDGLRDAYAEAVADQAAIRAA
jgi:glycosyltransferase involved in cell wall biosynthesis